MPAMPMRPGWYISPDDPDAEQLWDGEKWTGIIRARDLRSRAPRRSLPPIVVGASALLLGLLISFIPLSYRGSVWTWTETVYTTGEPLDGDPPYCKPDWPDKLTEEQYLSCPDRTIQLTQRAPFSTAALNANAGVALASSALIVAGGAALVIGMGRRLR